MIIDTDLTAAGFTNLLIIPHTHPTESYFRADLAGYQVVGWQDLGSIPDASSIPAGIRDVFAKRKTAPEGGDGSRDMKRLKAVKARLTPSPPWWYIRLADLNATPAERITLGTSEGYERTDAETMEDFMDDFLGGATPATVATSVPAPYKATDSSTPPLVVRATQKPRVGDHVLLELFGDTASREVSEVTQVSPQGYICTKDHGWNGHVLDIIQRAADGPEHA